MASHTPQTPSGADTFPTLLLHHAGQRGNRPAIREKRRGIWHTMTWRDLAEEATALAAALAARGLRRGAHIALVADNRPRLYAAMAAAHRLGAVAVPLYQDATAEELAGPIQNAEATHVFAENQEQVDKLLKILPRCPTVTCIVYDKDRGMRHYRQPELVSYAALVEQGRGVAASHRAGLDAEATRGNARAPAFLFYTPGASGPAKGVVLSHAALIDRARTAAAAEGLGDTDVTMAYLPPGWIGQTMFGYVQPMVSGGCVCCPESSETLFTDMREIAPTCFLATPRVLEALLTHVTARLADAGSFNRGLYRRCMAVAGKVQRAVDRGAAVPFGDRAAFLAGNLLIYGPLRDVLGLSRVRVAYAAGDAVAPDLLLAFRALGINLKPLYGSTETGFIVATPADGRVRPGTVGTATAGVELAFTAEREILVRSPGLFSGYHRDPAATAAVLNGDGWFRTGDAGHLDGDGHLRIVDRIADIGRLTDGARFAPKQIETAVKASPYIKDAVAFGDRRAAVGLLVDIDMATVSVWADRQGIAYTGQADLASRDEVYGLVAGAIAEANAALARDPGLVRAQVHRFAILPKELDADDGVLTRTGKLRRAVIAERHRALIDALHEGGAEAGGVKVGVAPAAAPLAPSVTAGRAA